MTRIAVLNPDDVDDVQADIFARTKAKFGTYPTVMAALTNSPATMTSYLSLFQNLAEGRFSQQLARKIGLAIGEENGCEYCISLLAAVARKQKLTDEDISLARQGKSTDAKEQALLEFVLLVIRHKGDLTDAEVRAVKDAGWTDEDIAETFGHLALNFLTNYFWKVARTDIDFPVLRLYDQSKIARGAQT